jgi:hypothetical protein
MRRPLLHGLFSQFPVAPAGAVRGHQDGLYSVKFIV